MWCGHCGGNVVRTVWCEILIPATRDAIRHTGIPYAIENVSGARYELTDPILLCGSMFGMRIRRHRYFEASVFMLCPPCDHRGQGTPLSVTGTGYGGKQAGHNATKPRDVAEAREVMGIEWMSTAELSKAIPPAYTEYIGRYLLDAVRERAA